MDKEKMRIANDLMFEIEDIKSNGQWSGRARDCIWAPDGVAK